jgi:hypothetical protein
MNNYTTTPTHIDRIQPGDTVKHEGELMTVSAANIKRGGFMGSTLFGDSYRLGTKPVELVTFARAK